MKNENYNLIIISTALRDNHYDEIVKHYWIPFINYTENNKEKYKIKIFLLYGANQNPNELDIPLENLLQTDTEENIVPGIMLKTLLAFEYVHNNYNYKHILRTNVNNFFMIDELIKLNNCLSNKELYAGVIQYPILDDPNPITKIVASGSGYWLSSDIVEYVLINKMNIQYTRVNDDVALALFLEDRIIPMSLPRYNINTDEKDNTMLLRNKGEILNKIIQDGHYHIKIKSNIDKNKDIEFYKEFARVLYKPSKKNITRQINNLNNEYEILILVIASRSIYYDQMVTNYWIPLIKYIKQNNYKIKIYLLYGANQNPNELNIPIENVINSDVKECVDPGLMFKTIDALEYVYKNYNYKHIFRTNLSSFIILENLIKYQKNLNEKELYAGIIVRCTHWNDIEYDIAAGSGFWMSPDIVEKLLEVVDYERTDWGADDCEIGLLLNGYVKSSTTIRYEIFSDEWTFQIRDKRELLNEISNQGHYHIRLRNLNNRQKDMGYYKDFAQILYK